MSYIEKMEQAIIKGKIALSPETIDKFKDIKKKITPEIEKLIPADLPIWQGAIFEMLMTKSIPWLPQNIPEHKDSFAWVQNEEKAKDYYVEPNTSIILMDSEKDVFYLKSADEKGAILPMRVFEFHERTDKNTD